MEKLKNRKDDIYNPEYKQEEPFITKKRKVVIIITVIIVGIFCYGASEFVYTNTVNIELRTVKDVRINRLNQWIIKSGEELFINYQVINKSPYSVKLWIYNSKIKDVIFETNYNDEIIGPDKIYYIWFSIINNRVKDITYKVEIGGKRT